LAGLIIHLVGKQGSFRLVIFSPSASQKVKRRLGGKPAFLAHLFV